MRAGILTALMVLVMTAAIAAPANQSSVHQEADFAAPPSRVYAALLDEKQFSAVTGAPARIDRSEGGSFSLFGGAIVGRTIELIPDKRVVQAWRDNDWMPGVYSVVRFELTPRGPGTHLVLDQSGFPPDDFHSLSVGWPAHYWEPLKKFFR